MARLYYWLSWLLDPDRVWKVLGWTSVILCALLLLSALAGTGKVYWVKWEVY